MPDQNDTAEDDEVLYDGANMHILESQRELVQKNMPEHDNIHPTPKVQSSKMNELASHVQKGEDTLKKAAESVGVGRCLPS